MAVSDEQEYQAAIIVSKVLTSHGFEAYVIGGAVRDILLNRRPKDFDLVTNAKPEQLRGLKGFESVKSINPAQAFGVSIVTVKVNGVTVQIEITTYRQDVEAHLGRKLTKIEFAHLEDDILRRDFTINALALDILNDYLVDEVQGINDLENRMVRFIGNPSQRILEDPLRIMRGIRLRNQLNFEYERDTKSAIISAIANKKLADIAVDRVRGELNLLLSLRRRYESLKDLDSLGALDLLLPELLAGKGVDQPKDMHAEGDVFTHSLLAVNYLPAAASLRLVWATLLHDIGKPVTQSMPKTAHDRIRFNGHYKVGAEMAAAVLERFNFSKKFTAEVRWMVEYHMGIDDLVNMTPAHQEKMVSHPAFTDLLELHKADAMAGWELTSGGKIVKPKPDFTEIEQVWLKFQEQQALPKPSIKHDLGIDGHWLQQEFNLPRGKNLGHILSELESAYKAGSITSKGEAREFVRLRIE